MYAFIVICKIYVVIVRYSIVLWWPFHDLTFICLSTMSLSAKLFAPCCPTLHRPYKAPVLSIQSRDPPGESCAYPTRHLEVFQLDQIQVILVNLKNLPVRHSCWQLFIACFGTLTLKISQWICWAYPDLRVTAESCREGLKARSEVVEVCWIWSHLWRLNGISQGLLPYRRIR